MNDSGSKSLRDRWSSLWVCVQVSLQVCACLA